MCSRLGAPESLRSTGCNSSGKGAAERRWFNTRPSAPSASVAAHAEVSGERRRTISVVMHTFGYIIRHDALVRSPGIVVLCIRKLARHYGRLSNTNPRSNSPGQSADNKPLYYRNNRPEKSACSRNQEIAFRGFSKTRDSQQSNRGKRYSLYDRG